MKNQFSIVYDAKKGVKSYVDMQFTLILRGSLTKSDITLRPFARPCVPTEPDPVY